MQNTSKNTHAGHARVKKFDYVTIWSVLKQYISVSIDVSTVALTYNLVIPIVGILIC